MNQAELANELEGVQWHGRYFSCICVFHDDTKPSMMVFDDGYRCLACNARGSLSKLASFIKGYTPKFSNFESRQNSHLPWFRWLSGRDIQELAWDAHRNLLQFPDQASYLKKRKIDHLIKDQHLGWLDGYYFFPVHNQYRKITGLVVRVGEGLQEAGTEYRYLTPPGQAPMLYIPSWELVREQSDVRIVFGIIDCLSIYSLGLACITGSNGKNINPELLDSIRKKLIIIPDMKEESDGLKLASGLGWRGSVKKMLWPMDCKDANDLFIHHGREALLQAI